MCLAADQIQMKIYPKADGPGMTVKLPVIWIRKRKKNMWMESSVKNQKQNDIQYDLISNSRINQKIHYSVRKQI